MTFIVVLCLTLISVIYVPLQKALLRCVVCCVWFHLPPHAFPTLLLHLPTTFCTIDTDYSLDYSSILLFIPIHVPLPYHCSPITYLLMEEEFTHSSSSSQFGSFWFGCVLVHAPRVQHSFTAFTFTSPHRTFYTTPRHTLHTYAHHYVYTLHCYAPTPPHQVHLPRTAHH